MEIPLTGLSTLTGFLVMIIAWLFVNHRIHTVGATVARPVEYLRKYFYFMAFFFTLMCVPHMLLYTNPALFPAAMAWGYVVGHIFLYIAFTYVLRMVFNIIPQLASKERWALAVGVLINVVITSVNFVTMVMATQPHYDYASNTTQFKASIIVGAAIGIFALLSLLPAGILFLVNAFKSHGGTRTRSLLLGIGFVLLTVAGPLHDVAQNWQSFLIADVFTIISNGLIGAGVAYRISSSLALSRPPAMSRAT